MHERAGSVRPASAHLRGVKTRLAIVALALTPLLTACGADSFSQEFNQPKKSAQPKTVKHKAKARVETELVGRRDVVKEFEITREDGSTVSCLVTIGWSDEQASGLDCDYDHATPAKPTAESQGAK